MPETATVYELPGTQQARPGGEGRGLLDRDDGLYVMERKFDGFRLLAEMRDGRIEGYSRAHRAQSIDLMLPHVHRALREALWEVNGIRGTTVLDGELYVDHLGRAHEQNHSHVASVMKSLPDRARELQGIALNGQPQGSLFGDRAEPLTYFAFDVLWYNGEDVRGRPWRARRELLEEAFTDCESFAVRMSVAGPPSSSQLQKWYDQGEEGAIIKRVDRPYVSWDRPRDNWYKVKLELTADVVCMGFTDGREGKGVRDMTDTFGAIMFGQYVGAALQYRGRASGMDDAERWGILSRKKGVDRRDEYAGKVFVIKHNGIQNPAFRHPRFLYWRDDKPATECTWD